MEIQAASSARAATAHVHEIIDRELPKMEGWCTPQKAKRMAVLVARANARRCVELGVFGGRSLVAMALTQRHVLGYGTTDGIDPYSVKASLEGSNDAANDEWWAKLDYQEILRGARAAIARLDLGDVARLYLERSQDAVDRYPDGSIDVLHVDSNHSVEVSCAEVETWHRKVRPGGYWIADDTNYSTLLLAQERLKGKGYQMIEDYESWRVYRREES